METGEQDKMLRGKDVAKKDASASIVAGETTEQEYFFPEHGATATGSSQQEALAKLTKAPNN